MGERTCALGDRQRGDAALRIDVGDKPVGVCCFKALNETGAAALPES
jgi:hypothetical protein